MEEHLKTANAGYSHFLKHLVKQGHRPESMIPINNSRYFILQTDKGKFLVMFKRDFFHNFGRYFREQGARGLGETVNIQDLKIAVRKEVETLIFIYPNKAVYSIPLQDFLTNSFKRTNKENKETRSISIHLLRRENPGSISREVIAG